MCFQLCELSSWLPVGVIMVTVCHRERMTIRNNFLAWLCSTVAHSCTLGDLKNVCGISAERVQISTVCMRLFPRSPPDFNLITVEKECMYVYIIAALYCITLNIFLLVCHLITLLYIAQYCTHNHFCLLLKTYIGQLASKPKVMVQILLLHLGVKLRFKVRTEKLSPSVDECENIPRVKLCT